IFGMERFRDYIYMTAADSLLSGGGVYRVAVDGSREELILPGAGSNTLTLDEAGLFWSEFESTYRAKLDGSNEVRIGEPTPESWGNQLAVADGRIYWATKANTVVSTTLDGGDPRTHYRGSADLIGPVIANGAIYVFEAEHLGSSNYILVSAPAN